MALKKGDFIEIEYEGSLDTGEMFDTTSEETAKKEGLYRQGVVYKPIVICLGEKQLLQGLEEELEGKEPGEYEISLEAERAFGKKDAKLIKLVPMNVFKKQNINPQPGLQLNADGMLGIVKTVSGGRVLVDFNPPLAGRDVKYKVKVNKIVTDDKEKIQSILMLGLNLTPEMYKLEIAEGKAKLIFKKAMKLPDELSNKLKEEITRLIPKVKEVSIEEEKESPKKEEKKA